MRDTLKMAPMITAGLNMQCKPNYREKNNNSPMFSMGRGQRPRIGAVPRDLALQP